MDTSFIQTFTPRQLLPQESDELQEMYSHVIEPDTGAAYDVWESLHAFFLSDDAHREQYYDSFFLWYVDLTWRFLSYVAPEDIAQVVSTQFHIACILGYDVWGDMITYLHKDILSEDEQIRLYADVRRECLNSPVRFPEMHQGKAYLVRDVVEQIRQQSSFESDTLSEATLFGVIERLYRYKEVPGIREKMYDDVTRAVQRLFQIIHFFLGVEDSAIGLIVRDYFLEKPKPKQESYEELHAELQKEQSLPPQPSIKPEPTPFQTTLTIAQQMDESHPEDILAYLDEQATLLGNDQIRDLYYYDEQTGVFAWNTDVLSNGNNG